MMRIRHLATVTALFAAAFLHAGTTLAQNAALSVRLVEADNSKTPNTASLRDVLPTLQRNLRFSSYRLLSSAQVAQRSGAQTQLAQNLTVTLTTVSRQSVTLNVSKKGRRLLQTRVVLAPGKPVILGGIPGDRGATLIVVVTTPTP